MLELAFFVVAGLASRNPRKIPAPHVDKKLAREDMIAGRRRRRRTTIHAGLAFESLAHEPLYHIRRGLVVAQLLPTGRCGLIKMCQVRNPPEQWS
jgi:hypothetical protein